MEAPLGDGVELCQTLTFDTDVLGLADAFLVDEHGDCQAMAPESSGPMLEMLRFSDRPFTPASPAGVLDSRSQTASLDWAYRASPWRTEGGMCQSRCSRLSPSVGPTPISSTHESFTHSPSPRLRTPGCRTRTPASRAASSRGAPSRGHHQRGRHPYTLEAGWSLSSASTASRSFFSSTSCLDSSRRNLADGWGHDMGGTAADAGQATVQFTSVDGSFEEMDERLPEEASLTEPSLTLTQTLTMSSTCAAHTASVGSVGCGLSFLPAPIPPPTPLMRGLEEAARMAADRAQGAVSRAIRDKINATPRRRPPRLGHRDKALGAKSSEQSAAGNATDSLGDHALVVAQDPPHPLQPPQRQAHSGDTLVSQTQAADGEASYRVAEECISPLPRCRQKLCFRKSTPIEVPNNTTLGRMIKEDPARATKYNLVAVPSWRQNKSWPPPPIRIARRPDEQSLTNMPDASEEPTLDPTTRWTKAGSALRSVFTVNNIADEPLLKRVSTKLSNATKRRLFTRMQSGRVDGIAALGCGGKCSSKIADTGLPHLKRPVNSSQPDAGDPTCIMDFSQAHSYFQKNEIDFLQACFERFATRRNASKFGRLTREGLQRALRAASLLPESQEEQRGLQLVQEAVIAFCRNRDMTPNFRSSIVPESPRSMGHHRSARARRRSSQWTPIQKLGGEDTTTSAQSAVAAAVAEFMFAKNNPPRNPLTDPHGTWEFDEFFLMAVGVEQLRERKAQALSQAVAEEVGVNCEEMNELLEVFYACGPKEDGCVAFTNVKNHLSHGLKGEIPNLDVALHRATMDFGDVNHLSFPDFIRFMAKASALMAPPRKKKGGNVREMTSISIGEGAARLSARARESTANKTRLSSLTVPASPTSPTVALEVAAMEASPIFGESSPDGCMSMISEGRNEGRDDKSAVAGTLVQRVATP